MSISKIKYTAMAFVGLFSCIHLYAQSGIGLFNTAEKLFADKKYFESAQVYEQFLAAEKKSNPKTEAFGVKKIHQYDPKQLAIIHLAKSYLFTNNSSHAEPFFEQAIHFSNLKDPSIIFYYAVTLRSNQKYAEAIEQLQTFRTLYKKIDTLSRAADRELDNLVFIQLQTKRTADTFLLEHYTDSNGRPAYAVSIKDRNTLAFTSVSPYSDVKGHKAFQAVIYESNQIETPFDAAKPLGIGTEQAVNEGMSCYSPDGNRLLFTRWVKANGHEQSAIYQTIKQDTGWTEPVILDGGINVAGYNSTQPYLTTDGRYLLFSSNRPGGFGGYDIWMAEIDPGFKLSHIQNAGSTINTVADEEAPYLHDFSGTLVFSSNGRAGMGDFDIYYSRGNLSQCKWSTPVNPGAPLNSSKADIYYISTDEKNLWNTGWISSDRETDCCLALFKVKQLNSQIVNGSVIDADSKAFLPGSRISVLDLDHGNKIQAESITDSAGKFSVRLHNATHFIILAKKDLYEDKADTISLVLKSLSDTLNEQNIYLQKMASARNEMQETIKILNKSARIGTFAYKTSTLKDSSIGNLDSLAALMRKFPTLKIQIEGYTDGIGGVSYNLKLSQKRVDACIGYLVSKGISADRLLGKAMGKCCPIEPEQTNGKDNPKARELNRRVQYAILE